MAITRTTVLNGITPNFTVGATAVAQNQLHQEQAPSMDFGTLWQLLPVLDSLRQVQAQMQQGWGLLTGSASSAQPTRHNEEADSDGWAFFEDLPLVGGFFRSLRNLMETDADQHQDDATASEESASEAAAEPETKPEPTIQLDLRHRAPRFVPNRGYAVPRGKGSWGQANALARAN